MQLELRTQGEEAGESRMLGRGFGRARQPLTQAQAVERRGGQHMIQVSLDQTAVARAPHSAPTHALRDGALHSGSDGVELRKSARLLSLPCSTQGLIGGLPSDRDQPPWILLARPDAARDARALRAVFFREADLDHFGASVVDRGTPADARAAFRTGRALLLPVDVEMLCREAGLLASLPVLVTSGRPHQVDAEVAPTGNQESRIDVA